MKKISISACVLGVALMASGCTGFIKSTEAGYDSRSTEFGMSNKANLAAQDAYDVTGKRLLYLGRDFSSNTTDTVTFAFDSADLDQTAMTALDTQVKWLKINKTVRMTIVGHTDLVGSKGYNKGLGLRRARAVLRYLNSQGISRKRLAAIGSRGELEPVIPTNERERRNRRAVTTVSGVVRKYSGFGLDGVYAARVYDGYQAGSKPVANADSAVN